MNAMVRIRILALIDRANHEATPVEEARTAAMIACKLIAEHPSFYEDVLEAVIPPLPEVVMPPVRNGRHAWHAYKLDDLPPPPEPRHDSRKR